jgi:hypothetical protein
MLLADPDPPTAAFQTRTGLSALELDRAGRHAARILDALVSVARLDAYAARDALHHPVVASALDDQATVALTTVIAAAGLGAGALSAHDHEAMRRGRQRREGAGKAAAGRSGSRLGGDTPWCPGVLPTRFGGVGVSAISCPQPLQARPGIGRLPGPRAQGIAGFTARPNDVCSISQRCR